MFRLNIRGINVLIPLYLEAIEYYLHIDCQTYLNTSFGQLKGTTTNYRERFTQIRSKSIQILLSILSLPFHYENLPQHLFEDYLEKSNDVQTTTKKTFAEFRTRIFPLLIVALQTENDTNNAQLLFGKFAFRLKRIRFGSLGTIRLICYLAAHHESNDDAMKTGKVFEKVLSNFSRRFSSDYVGHAVILICDKGTNDSHLFLAALDTLISIVTDPLCRIRQSFYFGFCLFLNVFL